MPTPQGFPVWYELLTDDADAAVRFYEQVVGWTVHPAEPGGMDYRMIDTGNHDHVGGLMALTDEMTAGGAKPTWLFYLGVDDVDATAAKAVAEGGTVTTPPITLEGVGRIAKIADPQGNPLYIMRGASEEDSTAWNRTAMGKCNWNELTTTDLAAGNAFYASVFGWSYPDKMTMPGEMGDYVFVEAGGETIGATMQGWMPGQPHGWLFYFRVPDIDAAAAKVAASGGTVHHGPSEVPGGDRIVVASDPQGVMVGLVGPGEGTK